MQSFKFEVQSLLNTITLIPKAYINQHQKRVVAFVYFFYVVLFIEPSLISLLVNFLIFFSSVHHNFNEFIVYWLLFSIFLSKKHLNLLVISNGIFIFRPANRSTQNLYIAFGGET